MIRRTLRLVPADPRGFTLIELLVVVALIGILSAITAPMLLRARMSANESSAIGSLKTVNSSQAAYASAAAPGGYASSFGVLTAACPGGSVGFISAAFSADPTTHSGYRVALGAGSSDPGPQDCNGNPSTLGYYVSAAPISVGLTGQRGFATSARAVMYYDGSGAPPAEAAVVAGTASALQ